MTLLESLALLAQHDTSVQFTRPTSGLVNAAEFSGPDWLARVNAAVAALPKGGTIEVPDSIAGTAATVGDVPANATLEFTGSGTFGFCQINVGRFSKIYNNDAVLELNAANCVGINQQNGAILQTSDKFILDGVRIDCDHQPNSTGIFVGSGHAQTSMRNVTVVNCTSVGIRLDGVQFGEFSNVSLYDNFVGLKIYSTAAGGGGNSNTFYGLKVVGSTVGVLIAANSEFGMGADYFVNPSLLENSAAAMAIFGRKWETDVHWYGGAPEHTGERGGQQTATIDGRFVQHASIYANLARVILNDVFVAEATINPFIRAENHSEVVLNNISGYGNTAGTLVSADSTSTTSLQGNISSVGTIENVATYPSRLNTSSYYRIVGAPLISTNLNIPNAFAGNANSPSVADIRGAKTSSTSTDSVMGPVTNVTYAATPGTQETNRVNFGNLVSSRQADQQDIVVSILLKASVDCTYVLEAYGDGYTATPVRLEAGKWTRGIIVKPKTRPGAGFTLVGWPSDLSGPTISFSKLEVLAIPAGSLEFQGYVGTVLTTGAVNPKNSAGTNY